MLPNTSILPTYFIFCFFYGGHYSQTGFIIFSKKKKISTKPLSGFTPKNTSKIQLLNALNAKYTYLPMKVIDKVFNSMQHYTTFRNKNDRGTGLGLMSCKAFLGKITVLSTYYLNLNREHFFNPFCFECLQPLISIHIKLAINHIIKISNIFIL